MVPGYHEVRELGTGGGGRVVLATYAATGAYVAIKYLNASLRGDRRFLLRFREEARVMVELADPNVVRFYEYYEDATEAAIVMELVDGVALRKILTAHGGTGPEAALVVLKGSLLGLAFAHSAGIVHRDYKPENVLIQADGGSKLTDFGVAAHIGEPDVPAGTPSYMAPEQWAGGPATPASDVYAATCVFFECLTGRRPYRADHPAALMHRHRTAPIPLEAVPAPMRGLVARGMAKGAVYRPPTAGAFVAELEAAAVAAYGPEWEQRGRRHLAELATLLALAFPLARPAPRANTSIARSLLGRAGGAGRSGRAGVTRRPRVGPRLLASAGVITVAVALALIAAGRSADRLSADAVFTPPPITPSTRDTAPRERGERLPPPPKAVVVANPPRNTAGRPELSSGTTAPGRPSRPTSASTSTPARPSPRPSSPSTPPVPVTPPPGTPSPSPSSSTAHAVTDLAITRVDATGAAVSVHASSPREVTLTAGFAEGKDPGRLVATPPRVLTLAGARAYTRSVPHAFTAPACGQTLYRRVTVSTSPGLPAGELSRTVEVRGAPCPAPGVESLEIVSFDGTAVRFRVRTTDTSAVKVRVGFTQRTAGRTVPGRTRVLVLSGHTGYTREVAGVFGPSPRCGDHVRRTVTITTVPGGGTHSREVRLPLPACAPESGPTPSSAPSSAPSSPSASPSASPVPSASPAPSRPPASPGPSTGGASPAADVPRQDLP
ncbi:hypothetical protein GCM10017673_32980 [Streptosporangium violaceochromogenes]|nr:hypothetical protein GCM10017673_32980 [Streptosporangium violaceochromogenes]